MKFELNKIVFLILWIGLGFIIISILAFLFIAFMYRISDFWLFSWIIPNGAEVTTPTNSAETIRNFAWLFWMFLSLSGAGLGLWLAWRGRQIQQESHLQERFEKAADMLSSELRATRVAACLSLADLGRADKSMKSRCVRLLFDFINEPYLEKNEVEIYIRLKGRKKDEYLNDLFPSSESLRPDIQQAIESFSIIYKHYSKAGIDDEVVKLPTYFWKNEEKGRISIMKANLQGADLQNAYLQNADLSEVILWGANLERADLKLANLLGASLLLASLQNANLQITDLNGANLVLADLQGASLNAATISNADMRGTKNVTKEQILSAQWGDNNLEKFGRRPQLPEDLMQDEDIKEWLKKPTYKLKKVGKIRRIIYKIRGVHSFFGN